MTSSIFAKLNGFSKKRDSTAVNLEGTKKSSNNSNNPFFQLNNTRQKRCDVKIKTVKVSKKINNTNNNTINNNNNNSNSNNLLLANVNTSTGNRPINGKNLNKPREASFSKRVIEDKNIKSNNKRRKINGNLPVNFNNTVRLSVKPKSNLHEESINGRKKINDIRNNKNIKSTESIKPTRRVTRRSTRRRVDFDDDLCLQEEIPPSNSLSNTLDESDEGEAEYNPDLSITLSNRSLNPYGSLNMPPHDVIYIKSNNDDSKVSSQNNQNSILEPLMDKDNNLNQSNSFGNNKILSSIEDGKQLDNLNSTHDTFHDKSNDSSENSMINACQVTTNLYKGIKFLPVFDTFSELDLILPGFEDFGEKYILARPVHTRAKGYRIRRMTDISMQPADSTEKNQFNMDCKEELNDSSTYNTNTNLTHKEKIDDNSITSTDKESQALDSITSNQKLSLNRLEEATVSTNICYKTVNEANKKELTSDSKDNSFESCTVEIKKTDIETEKHTEKQSDIETDKQTDTKTDKESGKEADKGADKDSDEQTNKQTDKQKDDKKDNQNEKIQTKYLEPTSTQDFNPCDEILRVVQLIGKYIAPFPQCIDIFHPQMGDCCVRRLRRALEHNDLHLGRLQFHSAVSRYNEIMKQLKHSGEMKKCIKEMKSIHPDIVYELLSQTYFRVVSPRVHLLRRYVGFSNNVYGELLPEFISRTCLLAGLKSSDVFIDFGSGVGNVVIQTALEFGCEAIGFEMMEQAASMGNEQASELRRRAEMWGFRMGKTSLYYGDFLVHCKAAESLKQCDVLLVNNFAFDAKLNLKITNMCIKHLRPGVKIISLRPFLLQGYIGNDSKKKFKNIIVSKEYTSYSGSFSWTNAPLNFYISTVQAG